jgi:hypothetical protein
MGVIGVFFGVFEAHSPLKVVFLAMINHIVGLAALAD